jgi:hypothetical protein
MVVHNHFGFSFRSFLPLVCAVKVAESASFLFSFPDEMLQHRIHHPIFHRPFGRSLSCESQFSSFLPTGKMKIFWIFNRRLLLTCCVNDWGFCIITFSDPTLIQVLRDEPICPANGKSISCLMKLVLRNQIEAFEAKLARLKSFWESFVLVEGKFVIRERVALHWNFELHLRYIS